LVAQISSLQWAKMHLSLTAKRAAKLQDKKPVLKSLDVSISSESFCPLLDKGYEHERKSNAGRKRIDQLILSKSSLSRSFST